jgi:hypothetical protein
MKRFAKAHDFTRCPRVINIQYNAIEGGQDVHRTQTATLSRSPTGVGEECRGFTAG